MTLISRLSSPVVLFLLSALAAVCPESLFAASAGPRQQADVMWGLSGVLPRDRAHWIRNFDFRQRVPGIAPVPVDFLPEDPSAQVQPEDLQRLASACDEVGCRFFFVVELAEMRERIQSTREGKRTNYQQTFRQPVSLTAYRKPVGQTRWEKLKPVIGTAEAEDRIGTSDTPKHARTLRKNQQRCEFLRKIPAEKAAELMGKVLVDVQGKNRLVRRNGQPHFEYTLTNRSPLPLSTIQLQLPIKAQRKSRTQRILFEEKPGQVRTLGAHASASSSTPLDLREGERIQVDQAWVIIDGWTQQEFDSRKARRKRHKVPRTEWQEHEHLPPPAHEMNWETEAGELP